MAAETKALGVGAVYGMSMAPGNDFFATLVWLDTSNAMALLQLVSLAADGAMSTYASTEFAESPLTFAPCTPKAATPPSPIRRLRANSRSLCGASPRREAAARHARCSRRKSVASS
jgi:hypothetical protein